jgi:hypothetical protein
MFIPVLGAAVALLALLELRPVLLERHRALRLGFE